MTDDRSKGLLKSRTFWIRTASGFVMACILVLVFVLGYDIMLAFMCILSLLGMYELNRAVGLGKDLLPVIGYATMLAHYIFLRFFDNKYIILIYAAAIILYLVVFVFTFPKYSLQQLFGSFFSIFYVGVSFSFLYLTRIHPPSGAYIVWLIVLSAWGCDVFAYLVGMIFGKHPLVPRLSPKKSVEGAIGGVAGSVVLAIIYGIIVQPYIPDIKFAPVVFAITCFFGSIVSQVGDLAASAIKRKVNIKDYGRLLPGHGGVLDRFDSMIIVAPIMYLVTIYASLI